MASEERPPEAGPRPVSDGVGARGGPPFRRRSWRRGAGDPGAAEPRATADTPGASHGELGGLKIHWPEQELDHLVRPEEVEAEPAAPYPAAPPPETASHPAPAPVDLDPEPEPTDEAMPEPETDPDVEAEVEPRAERQEDAEVVPEPRDDVMVEPDLEGVAGLDLEPEVTADAEAPAAVGAPPALLVARPATVDGALNAVSMRLDHLLTESTTFRAVVSDRLVEYAELVSRLSRSQSDDIEAHRQATDRVLAEVRRSMATNEETARRLAGRVDEVADDVSTLREQLRLASTEAHATAVNADALVRRVPQAIDDTAARVVAGLDETSARLADGVAGLRADLTTVQRDIMAAVQRLSAEVTTAGAATETTTDVAVRSQLTQLLDAVSALRDQLAAVADRSDATVADELADIRGLLGGLRDVVVKAADGGEPGLRADIADLKSGIARLGEELKGGIGTTLEDDFGDVRGILLGLREDVVAISNRVTALASRDGQSHIRQLADQVTRLGAEVGAGGQGIEAVRTDVAEVTSRLDALVESTGQLSAGLRHRARPDDDEGQLDEIRDELTALREELGSLRRRIPVKAKAVPSLTPEELETLADAVATRLQQVVEQTATKGTPEEPRGRRWR